jgi:hypothetical protein
VFCFAKDDCACAWGKQACAWGENHSI